MTNSIFVRESAVMMSSTMPSAKYSCSASPLKFWNGRTAIDGFSGRASVGNACVSGAGRAGGSRSDAIDPDRPGNILDLLLALVVEGEVELVAHLIEDHPADADAAWLGKRFQPGGDIDAVAIDVVVVADDVADIDADAKLNALVGPNVGIALGHAALHLDRAAHRIDDAGEFHQYAVAGGFDNAAAVLLDLEVDEVAPDCLQRRQSALLIGAHQP